LFSRGHHGKILAGIQLFLRRDFLRAIKKPSNFKLLGFSNRKVRLTQSCAMQTFAVIGQ